MTTDVVPIESTKEERLNAALIKAMRLDRVPAEQRELTLAIGRRYDLDPMLQHLMLIEGQPYVTHKGLLWVAHRSGQLDGIEVIEDPAIVTIPGLGEFWRCKVAIYRKDMSHPFAIPGRYSTRKGNVQYGPEMAIKTSECLGLRRAFNVAAPVYEERWDIEATQPSEPARPLAERVAERAEALAGARTATPDLSPGSAEAGIVPQDDPEPAPPERCGALPPEGGLDMTLPCEKPAGHGKLHRSAEGSWHDDPVPVKER